MREYSRKGFWEDYDEMGMRLTGGILIRLAGKLGRQNIGRLVLSNNKESFHRSAYDLLLDISRFFDPWFVPRANCLGGITRAAGSRTAHCVERPPASCIIIGVGEAVGGTAQHDHPTITYLFNKDAHINPLSHSIRIRFLLHLHLTQGSS